MNACSIPFNRLFLLFGFLLVGFAATMGRAQSPHFASGIKVGEVNQDSAIIWVRLTKNKVADFDRLPILTEGLPSNARLSIEMPDDLVSGIDGQVRLRYWVDGRVPVQKVTNWMDVDPDADFTHQFKIRRLKPGTPYRFTVESRASKTSEPNSVSGRFKTAPLKETEQPVNFLVTTCQAVRSIDAGANGHVAYKQMLALDPDFFVHTGDIVYYDKVPLAKNMARARAKWNLMFAYRHNLNFHRNVSSYFMKDDHDTLKNDCWPGQKYGDLTFQEGLRIFREQVPMGDKTYRTVRWGRDLQIWMTENRDFRSPNKQADGPEKTILGAEQKAWLKKTLAESDATFKFIITPGPIVGPDKKGKNDNHSNGGFSNEGQELRDFISKQANTYVICGDRHWQYCSKDPETGVLEMGCGPINDQHSFGGNPGKNKDYHKYFSAKGGFLRVSINGNAAKAEWFNSNDVDPKTGEPVVLHTERFTAIK